VSEEAQPAGPRKPVVGLQIKLPCATRDELKERHGTELAKGTLFVRTRSPKPVSTLIRFDVRLNDATSVLRGVALVRESLTDSARPGMLLQLKGVDVESQELLKELGVTVPVATLRPVAERPFPLMKPAPVEASPPPPIEATIPLPEIAPHLPGISARGEPTPTVIMPPVHATPLNPVVGIDLGTTNTAVAWMHNGKPMVLSSREGYNTVPSVFAVDERERTLIGHPAKGQLLKNPRNTVYGAKRLIGRAFHSEARQQIQERLPYTIVEGSRGECAVQVAGRTFTLQDISSRILKEVREIAHEHLGQDVTRAVITVPAYYSDGQRQAVREAGALAGMTVEQIVSEPTAAAVAFGHGRALQQRVLVYDLGGGTFDVSVLELHGNNIYEVISTGGDTFLGGVDFDLRILGILLSKFEARIGREFDGDAALTQRFLDATEKAKIALSEVRSQKLVIPFVDVGGGRLIDFETEISRAEIEQATADLIDRTMKVTAEVLAAKQLKPTDIDEVLLVGGQSRMPLVRERLKAYFGKDPNKSVHPDEAVALGAALLAHSIETEATDSAVLIDVLPMSIGIGVSGGKFRRVIERNTTLPHTRTHVLSTTKDDQTELELLIFQGESDRALDNQFLGSVTIDGLPKAPRGAVKVDVTFRLSREALLTLTVKQGDAEVERPLILATRENEDQLREKLDETPKTPTPKGGVFSRFKRWFGGQA
jgi:molecular chaperone DnaK